MKLLALLPFITTAVLHMAAPAVAAPPGIQRFLTVAGTQSAGCSGHDLSTIGFTGTTGAPCVSLADGAETDVFLTWELDNCTIDLFTQAGCSDDSLVIQIPIPAVPGSGACTNVPSGFRALNVTCF